MPEEKNMKAREKLTAAQAADRVAGRQGNIYTCEQCGGHDFDVERSYVRLTTHTDTLICGCPAGGDCAGHITRQDREIVTEWWQLDDDGEYTEMDEQGIDGDVENEEIDSEVECPDCVSKAEPLDWARDPCDSESEDIDEELYVKCESCGHEIEFGWSGPNRDGRIWPCESADFVPGRSWPEPRYRDAWLRRGWSTKTAA